MVDVNRNSCDCGLA